MITNRFSLLIIIFCFLLSACGQSASNRNVDFFKETKAYDLAKAVYSSDISKIEKLIKSDTSLLTFNNPTSGSNVLFLSIYTERYDALKKLLELGGNPNSINSFTKYSLLMVSIRPFGSQFEWRWEHQFAELLLEKGANPNYVVEEDFINQKGHHVVASSPLMNASDFNLDAVKLLLKYGADPKYKLKQNQSTPFSNALRSGKIDIINYYIDSLHADIFQPMSVVVRQPDNIEVTFYIQDYIVNKYTLARLKGDNEQIEKLTKQNKEIAEVNKELWELIERLKKMGVDFDNYDYKLN